MKFMDVHTDMKGITQEQLAEAHAKDLEAEKGTGVHFEHAWADPATGRVFCLSEGPDIETVKEVHRKAGHPADEIFPVGVEV
jgi:hypothetical protein